MGYIYKVTSKINGKIYIGKTESSIEERWKSHLRASFNENHKDYNLAFHRAIRKYGEDNFTIEQIDTGIGATLKEKEQSWIVFYDSYKNGYNSTLGGDGQCKYNYQEIVDFYKENNGNLKLTCQHFKIYDQVVYSALKAFNINSRDFLRKRNKKYNKKILLVEENLLFNTMAEIDKYFGKTVHPNIRRCLNGITKKAYGYSWREIEDGEDLDNFRLAF
jgi:group I intron endonuclease